MWNMLLPTILRMSFTGSIVILVVLLARLLLRRTPKIFSYLLWGVVLLRLLCPISFSTHLSVMQFVDVPERAEEQIKNGLQKLTYHQNVSLQASHAKVAEYVQKQTVDSPSSAKNTPKTILYIGTIVWLMGVAIVFTYSIISLLKFRKSLIGAVQLRDNIYLTDYVTSAFVLDKTS